MLQLEFPFVSRDASCQPQQGAAVPVGQYQTTLVKLQAAWSGSMTYHVGTAAFLSTSAASR